MNEKLEQAKLSLQNTNDIKDVKNNPIVQVLLSPIKKVPVFGTMIDSTTDSIISNFQQKKEQELLDVILQNKNTITSEMVNDVEFIINCNKIWEAVRRLATNDKVKFFGNLIRNGYLSEDKIENSEFEEYLYILNTMSYREIECLTKYYQQAKSRGSDKLVILQNEYVHNNGLEEDERIIFRLIRTGFVEENIGISTEEREPGIYHYINIRDGFVIQESFIRFYEMVLKVDIN